MFILKAPPPNDKLALFSHSLLFCLHLHPLLILPYQKLFTLDFGTTIQLLVIVLLSYNLNDQACLMYKQKYYMIG